jgi:hypothetical protein
MTLRDDVENELRAWDAYERRRGAAPIIDFDCAPTASNVEPADSRLGVLARLTELRERVAAEGSSKLLERLDSDVAYLRAMLGERPPLATYLQSTLGCAATGWPATYLEQRRDALTRSLAERGIGWHSDTTRELEELEGRISADDAPDAIREAADQLESRVRALVGSTAPYRLTIETTDEDAYWAYWLDGSGEKVRLQLNIRHGKFTKVLVRQFALHEVLGHGLQSASIAARCREENPPWVRLLSVHTGYSVVSEGLAQALPLFATPDDAELALRVEFTHFAQLVRAELHLRINRDDSIESCVKFAQEWAPFWDDDEVGNTLTDQSTNPLLRTYLWSYPAGIDWFMALRQSGDTVAQEVLHAAYREPLTPTDLGRLWPGGPAFGGA